MTASGVRGYICNKTEARVDQETDENGNRWCSGRPPHLHLRRSDGSYEGARRAGEASPEPSPNGPAKSSFLVSPFKGRNEKRETQQSGLTTMTLTELRATAIAGQSWLLDGLLVQDGTSLWAAKPKTGKSVILRNLARAVASGRPFLGRATRDGPVLVVSLEDRASRVREHFETMGGADAIGDRIILHVGAAPERGAEALGDAIQQHKPALAVVDTTARLVRFRDINDYAEVTRQLEPIGELARRFGCHIALSHHLGKGERVDDGDGVLGSTALFGAVDTLVILKRRPDGTRTIATIQREGDDLDETVLTIDDRGLVTLGQGVEERQMADAEAAVLAALGSEELPEDEVRARAGGNSGLVGTALRRLSADRIVFRRGEGKRGSPYVYRVGGPVRVNPENEKNEEND